MGETAGGRNRVSGKTSEAQRTVKTGLCPTSGCPTSLVPVGSERTPKNWAVYLRVASLLPPLTSRTIPHKISVELTNFAVFFFLPHQPEEVSVKPQACPCSSQVIMIIRISFAAIVGDMFSWYMSWTADQQTTVKLSNCQPAPVWPSPSPFWALRMLTVGSSWTCRQSATCFLEAVGLWRDWSVSDAKSPRFGDKVPPGP